MCGIAFILSLEKKIDLSIIREMTGVVRHRGPDDEGFVFWGNGLSRVTCLGGSDTPEDVFASDYLYSPESPPEKDIPSGAMLAMGHRRLSIIDLSPSGHQPMCSGDGRYWIVYNGEIYNYLELRKELESEGIAFQSNTDTEVVLASYHMWGAECLQRFNGMFAFVMFDIKERKIFSARDRFGVKPFYYWFSPEGFLAFASEIKQFTVLPGWSPVVNGQRAYDFLRYAVNDHTRETLFEGVYQLRGGEYVECNISQIKRCLPIERWYRLKNELFNGNEIEAADIFRNIFIDAINLRLRADVPIGTSFSGGLDSSSIVCIVNDLLKKSGSLDLQKTFSSCSELEKYDEREFIAAVVESKSLASHMTFPQIQELFDVVQRLIWHHDEPFSTTSIFAEWKVYELISKKRVKVTLDGHGADEILAGYYSFFPMYFATLIAHAKLFKLAKEIRDTIALHGYPYSSMMAHMLKSYCDIAAPSLLAMMRKRMRPATWANTTLLRAEDVDPEISLGIEKDTLQKNSFIQLFHTSMPKQLHWNDRDSMAHSVETRLPFLDYRLVEFIMGLPDEFKISGGVTKRVLRQAMNGILPEKVRVRKDKMGFVTPEKEWLCISEPKRFLSQLRKAVEQTQGILTEEAIRTGERVIAGKEQFSYRLWRMVAFGEWMARFSVRVR